MIIGAYIANIKLYKIIFYTINFNSILQIVNSISHRNTSCTAKNISFSYLRMSIPPVYKKYSLLRLEDNFSENIFSNA